MAYVFDEMMHEGRAISDICREPNMPDKSNVVRWCGESEEVSQRYARAREGRIRYHADTLLEEVKKATPENVQVVKLWADTVKWIASKLIPDLYGDRQKVEHSGKIESITVNVTRKEPPK